MDDPRPVITIYLSEEDWKKLQGGLVNVIDSDDVIVRIKHKEVYRDDPDDDNSP